MDNAETATLFTDPGSMLETTMAPEPGDNLVWGVLGFIAISSLLLFHYWIKKL